MCFLWISGDARGLGLLFMVCACAVGLRGNVLTWMRGTWGVFWRSAHVPTIPFTWLRRAKALDRTAHASYHHATRGLPMNAYVLYPMRSRKQIDDVPYANESRTLKYNTPIVFLALWLVETWSSPIDYWGWPFLIQTCFLFLWKLCLKILVSIKTT